MENDSQAQEVVKQSETAFRQLFLDLHRHGKRCAPRGLKVIELEDYQYVLPPYVRFSSFAARKFKPEYLKHEFLWYLRGWDDDLSILTKAEMWKSLVNHDGTINSNYGRYIFKPGKISGKLAPMSMFDQTAAELQQDKDSRRASIAVFSNDHVRQQPKDLPCTYSLNFRIRDDKLNMGVHMRSQDAVFGMGNDAPCFSFIHEMLYVALVETYPELRLGTYTHTADSFHIYERHFELLEKLVDGDPYVPTPCPRMLPGEHRFLQQELHLTYELLGLGLQLDFAKGTAMHKAAIDPTGYAAAYTGAGSADQEYVAKSRINELLRGRLPQGVLEAFNSSPEFAAHILSRRRALPFSTWLTTSSEPSSAFDSPQGTK